ACPRRAPRCGSGSSGRTRRARRRSRRASRSRPARGRGRRSARRASGRWRGRRPSRPTRRARSPGRGVRGPAARPSSAHLPALQRARAAPRGRRARPAVSRKPSPQIVHEKSRSFWGRKWGWRPIQRRREAPILAAMPKKDPLLDEISALLAAGESGDDPVQLERTLTDGYARALTLEAERRRLQKQIGSLTVTVGEGDLASRRELAALIRRMKRQEDDLGVLRDQLG